MTNCENGFTFRFLAFLKHLNIRIIYLVILVDFLGVLVEIKDKIHSTWNFMSQFRELGSKVRAKVSKGPSRILPEPNMTPKR